MITCDMEIVHEETVSPYNWVITKEGRFWFSYEHFFNESFGKRSGMLVKSARHKTKSGALWWIGQRKKYRQLAKELAEKYDDPREGM